MSEYSDFPPFSSFKLVLISHPGSALIYISLWKQKDQINHLAISRKEVRKNFYVSPTRFRNHLLNLVSLSILSFEETHSFFLIQFHSC
jgi:hypothetical protein